MRVTFIAVITALVSIGSTASPATADDDIDPSSRMVLVLDSSGSMAEKTPDGTKRIDAAKDALRRVIAKLPDDQEVGLRVYGAKVFDRQEAGACTDSQLIVKPGTDNRKELEASLKGYKPYGETPIGYALQEAGKDLGSEGPRTIVLVSDGEPTCDPDPCKVAEQLSEDGVDVRIDVVGLDVSGKARDKLKCVAEKGNGTYYDADSADELVDSLDTSTTRASRPFDLTGEPVEGTPTLDDTTPVLATGQYLDRVPVNGEVFYRIPRTADHSTIHVGVVNEGEGGASGSGVAVTTYVRGADGKGHPCNNANSHTSAVGERRPFNLASTSSWKRTPTDACNTADEVIVGIKPLSGNIGGKPVEIAVFEEAPLADPSGRDLAPVPVKPTWTTLTPADAQDDVIAGTSIASAPVVEDGTYALDINPGETQVVAVPLDWGQNVQAQMDAHLSDDVLKAAAVGSDIVVDIIGPLRSDPGVSFYANEPDDWFTTALSNAWLGDEREFRTGAQSYTAAYLNRDASDGSVRSASLPGLHYIRIRYNVRGDEANLPYTLTIKHNGTAGEGAPTYAESGDAVAPAADSRLTVSPEAKKTAEKRAAGSGPEDGLPWLPIGLGAAGVLALTGAGIAFKRGRSMPAS